MYHFGLIGHPIKHSLSPWIHEHFLKLANETGSYSLIDINPDKPFEMEIKKLKKLNLDGFNVTVPYKQKIIPFLDELDLEAEKIGAVNTVVHSDGRWIGYNTDGKGYVRSLESAFPNLFTDKNKRCLVVGAGGAARGIYYALSSRGFKQLDIANRTQKSGNEIAALGASSTKTIVMSIEEAQNNLRNYDIIIQTTSVGMRHEINQSILSLNSIKKSSIVSDIIYQPIETNFLKQAKSLGASVHFGHTMLLYQAQYAFEIWTDKLIPIKSLENDLLQILKGR